MDQGVYRTKSESSEGESDKKELVEPWLGGVAHKNTGNRICLIIAVVVLAVTLVIVLSVMIGLAVGLGVEKNRGDDVCTTVGCVQLSAQLSSRMNMSADPCEDFIEFACGGWRRNNVFPPGSSWYRMYPDQIQANPISVRQQKILESGNDGGVEAVRKAMNFYKACMDTTVINAVGNQPLYDLVMRTGGWPLLGFQQTTPPWSVNSTNFFYEKRHKSPVFFTYTFQFDDKDVSKYVLHFRQTEPSATNNLLIRRNYDETAIATAQAIVLGFLSKYGTDSTLNMTAAANAIVQLDTQIVDIFDPPSSYNRTVLTLSEIKREWNWFDVEGYVRQALDDAGYTSVDPNTLRYSLNSPMYFQRLGQLLQNTSNNVIMDYAKFYFLVQYFGFLSGSTSAVMPGDLTYCLSLTEQVLPIALARPYVEQYVPKETKETVTMIVNYIVRSFRARIQRVDWLSDISRQRSLEKLDAVLENVAYPDQLFNDTYLNDIYQLYVSNATDFFGNNVRAQEITDRNLIRQWIIGVNRTEWLRNIAPTTINGFYQQSLNQFYLLLGIETPPIFNVDWPAAFNFGGFGGIVGHETTHGYDNNGQQFDQNGIKRMWWSNESQQEFNSRLTCFVEQYGNYSFLDVPVNGSNTLSENLADNGGIQTSFEAYSMMVRESGKSQQRLPSLPLTPEQYFFLAWGQLRGCELARAKAYEFQRLNDVHAPNPARVIGPLQNSEDFARVYNCPLGSTMNPRGRKRCQLW